MKIFKFSFLLYFLLGIHLAQAFCVQSFNTYGPVYAPAILKRTELMSQQIRKEHCEYVQLQEVWNADQINLVKDEMVQYDIFSPNSDNKIGIMGLYSSQILEKEFHFFRLNSDSGILDQIRKLFSVKKAFSAVLLRNSDTDEPIYFVNTHLHPQSQVIRLTQILDLLEWRMSHNQNKLIMSGDYNFDPGSLERYFLTYLMGVHDSYEATHKQYSKMFCTYCSINPRSWLNDDHVFDYIFYSNISDYKSTLLPTEVGTNLKGSPKFPLSDHYGLKAQFDVSTMVFRYDDEYLEVRRNYTIKLLAQVERIFLKKKSKDFEYHLKLIKDLKTQLETKSGNYFDYFESFR